MSANNHNVLTEITMCEVCGDQNLASVLDLGLHPLCDDLLPIGAGTQCHEFPIDILFCAECKTAHQRFQVNKSLLFPDNYHYRSNLTNDVLLGMQDLTSACLARFGDLHGKTVLDIGCNDGSLLGFFAKLGAKTIGVEPTNAASDAMRGGHQVFKAFWNQETAKQIRNRFGSPDVITFTNVFAHISNLAGVLAALKLLITDDTVLVVENHYLGSIIEKSQFDSFYHEHPRTYSFRSFQYIADSLGLPIHDVAFPSRYGGNIRVFMTKRLASALTADQLERLAGQEAAFGTQLKSFTQIIENWRADILPKLAELVAVNGPLNAKAFPGRAAILLKLLGIDTETIKAVYERPNSMKIGHYVPGTRIPILSETDFFEQSDMQAPLVNLAWHIRAEITAYMAERGFRGQILDIMAG